MGTGGEPPARGCGYLWVRRRKGFCSDTGSRSHRALGAGSLVQPLTSTLFPWSPSTGEPGKPPHPCSVIPRPTPFHNLPGKGLVSSTFPILPAEPFNLMSLGRMRQMVDNVLYEKYPCDTKGTEVSVPWESSYTVTSVTLPVSPFFLSRDWVLEIL